MMMSKINSRQRADLYRLLSRLYRVEVDRKLLDGLKALTFPTADGVLGEGYEMLKSYLDSCGDNALEELAVDYATVFLAAGSADGAAAIPCESVYTSPKKIFMQDAWEDVRRIYGERSLGKNDAFQDLMEDHVAVEVEFMATLVESREPKAELAFLEDHLLNWMESFTADIDKYARCDFYKAVGRITLGFLRSERELLTALAEGELNQSSSFSVRNERFANVLARLKEHYHVYAPKRGPKGTGLIRYGEIDALTDIVYKEPLCPGSQFDNRGAVGQTVKDDKTILLICRPCDRKFITLPNADKVRLVALECFDDCACGLTDCSTVRKYAAVMHIDDICALVEVCDEELLPYFADEVPIDFTPRIC